MSTLAPIALFVYGRPDHTARTLAALAANEQASASELYIYSDAARSAKDEANIAAVRHVAHQCTGFKAVHVIERPENFGLAKSITDGVNTLTAQYGKVIVVEDDLVTGPGFLTYMNAALDRYAADERVMQISGFNHSGEFSGPADTFFLPFPTSWGWATWARAWAHWGRQEGLFDKLEASPKLRRKFDLDCAYPYYQMLLDQRAGRNNSWAIRWYLVVFSLGGLVLFPRRSLVNNIGFDGSGEHCGDTQEHVAADLAFRPASFPKDVAVQLADYAKTVAHLKSLRPPLAQRMLTPLKQAVKKALRS